MIRKLVILLLVLLPAAAVLVFATGLPWLEGSAVGTLPNGNLLAAIAMLAWPAAACLVAPAGSGARRFALAAFVLALAWLPLSAMLAGNLALNFGGQRGSLWLGLTALVMILGLAALLASMARRLRRADAR